MTEHLSQRWSLNDEQKQRLGVVLAKWHERRGPAPAGAGAAGADPAKDPRSDLSALIAGDKFNVDKATALTQARADAIRSRSPELIAAAAAFYDGLKPEQQAKVREFLARGPGDGPHNGPHGGPRRMGAMGDDQGARQPG